MATCRFCKETAAEDWLVKYNVRHYAHPDCYLNAGRKVDDLSQWQQDHFDEKYADWVQLLERRGQKAKA